MPAHVESLGPSALSVTIDGKLREEDYADFVPLAEDRIEKHGKVNLLVHVIDFAGWTPSALWRNLAFDVSHYSDVPRLAIVGEDSSDRWMATVSKPFTAADVQYFSEDELDAARDWVQHG